MEWTRETRLKLAKMIREVSLEIQGEEFFSRTNFPDMVERTIGRIMKRLEPLGFEKADRDWEPEFHENLGMGYTLNVYKDSQTHLWFETAQSRIVKIKKDLAHKLLVLGFP